ncbi:MAG: PepSY domain-containing protein [Bacillota bacterium]
MKYFMITMITVGTLALGGCGTDDSSAVEIQSVTPQAESTTGAVAVAEAETEAVAVAETGAEATAETVAEPVPIASTTASTATTPPATSTTTITEAEAKAIALEHAGLAEADVTFMITKLDYDNGIQEYEVEFYSGQTEYDYEINASTGEIISFDYEMETPRATTPAPAQATSTTTITEAEAKAIALEHAGLAEADVTFMITKLDYDNGIQEYEVEFYSGQTEYDYEINASTGEIISFDYDTETPRATTPAPAQATSTTTITEAEAKAIALEHAGLAEADVTFMITKLDYDNGIQEYEVEFYSGQTEYDYEINASTGEIISFDYDMETAMPQPATNNQSTTDGTISEAEAKAAALSHAGLTEADISRFKIEKDYDDGRWEYEIEFYSGQWEYEYEIDASTAAIVNFSKDND